MPSDWPLIPDGVGAGESFRLLFVTSTIHNASSSEIADYNAHVQAAAGRNSNLAGFSGKFRALISTASVDARDNTATTGAGVSIHWLGGARVADDYADLYDRLWDSVSGTTEAGASYTGLVWTGGNKAGLKSGKRHAGAAEVRLGDLGDAGLALSSPRSGASGEAYPLYALSPVITVAQPVKAEQATGIENANVPRAREPRQFLGQSTTDVWSTTLTVKVEDNDEGCDNFDSSITNCSSALGEDDFTYNSVTYTIVSLFRYTLNGELHLRFDKDIDDSLKSMTLHVGTNTYAISSGTISDSNKKQVRFINTPALVNQQQYTVKLTVTATAPNKPTGLMATAGIGQVKLTWDDPSDSSITSWEYQQKAGSAAWGAWTAISGSGATTTSYTVTGLMGGTYQFRIRAVNAGGNSPQSNVAGPVTVVAVGTGTPTGQTVASDWALIPKDTNNNALVAAGGKFRLLFVTSGTTTATSTDISTYNAFVQNAANSNTTLKSFATRFRAVISTSTVDARDNTATTGTGVPIYWVKGDRVANDYADFYDGSWDSIAGKSETGGARSTTIWTGSNNNGTKHAHHAGNSAAVRFGALGARLSPLFDGSISAPTLAESTNSLYGLSPVLTVAGQTSTDTTAPTVTASATGYYSDAALSTASAGTQSSGANIYTKVTFSEDMYHVKSDAAAARPALSYRIGSNDTRYDILDNSDTLASGDCKPNHATNTNVYVCRYTVVSTDSGAFTLKVGTASVDKSNNALANAYTHTTTLTLGTTLSTKPATPTGLTLTAGDGQVTLGWDDPNDATITKYQVWHRESSLNSGGSGWQDVPDSAPGGANATSWTVTGLTNETRYTFWLRAVNNQGESGTVQKDAAPAPRAATKKPGKPRIDHVEPGIRQFTVYITNPNDPSILRYQVSLTPPLPSPQNFGPYRDIPGSHAESTVLVVRVPENGSFRFMIRAVNALGFGPIPSNSTPATAGYPSSDGKRLHGVDVWGFKATPGDGQIKLSWRARHTGYCGYIIEWREKGTEYWWKYRLGGWGRNPRHTITGLENGKTYQVRVWVSAPRYTMADGLAFGPQDATPNIPSP